MALLNKIFNNTEAVILIEAMDARGGTELVALNLADALNAAGVPTIIVALHRAAMSPLPDHVCWLSPEVVARYNAQPESRLELLIGSTRRDRAMQCLLVDLMQQTGARALINFTYEAMRFLPDTSARSWLNVAVFHWSVKGYENSIFDIIAKKGGVNRVLSGMAMRRRFARLHECLTRADRLVALTEAGRRELVSLGAKAARTEVIANFLPYDKPAGRVSDLSSGRAVFVGRLSVEKGVWRLLDIWERISSARPDVHLDIYGEGAEREALEAAVSERGIGNITFRGFERDASKIYDNADMLFCTSYSEGFGMVLIEAMYHGVLPVTFDCPVSPAEIVADGGEVIPCFDIDRYAHTVVSLWSDRERMAALQQRAIRRASDYLRPKIIEQWKQLLRQNGDATTLS